MLSSREALIALADLDARAARLRTDRERLPEREHLATASAAMRSWEAERQRLTSRIAELEQVVDQAERRGADLTAQRDRLDGQLKTVIAPREAEALMHEIATIDGQRDELDLAELGALEEQTDLEGRLSAHVAQDETVRTAVRLADQQLAEVVSSIDAELATLEAPRADARGLLDRTTLSQYDRLVEQLGSAVGILEGRRCNGCHLDLSAAEVDTARDEGGDDGITDCPQCGRLLIV